MFNIDNEVHQPEMLDVAQTALSLQAAFQMNTADFSDWSELVEEYTREDGEPEAREMMAHFALVIETAHKYFADRLGGKGFLSHLGDYGSDIVPMIAEQIAGSLDNEVIDCVKPVQVAEVIFNMLNESDRATVVKRRDDEVANTAITAKIHAATTLEGLGDDVNEWLQHKGLELLSWDEYTQDEFESNDDFNVIVIACRRWDELAEIDAAGVRDNA